MPYPVLSVVVAEELALVREGIVSIIEHQTPHQVIGQAEDGERALELVQQLKPDVILLNLYVERMHALEVVRQIHAAHLPTKTVVLAVRKDRKTVLEVLRGGAQALLLKSSTGQHLADCLIQVYEGGIYVSPEINLQQIFAPDRNATADPLETLSSREYQVFSLLIEGVRAKEIAASLKLSPKTIDTYRASLMRKLNIHDVAGLVKFAIQKRLTMPDG